MSLLPFITAVWLFIIGLYGIISSRNLIHLIVCLSVVQSSTYLLILSAGYRKDAGAPVFDTVPPTTPAVDPIGHALVLTDIVVGATAMALLLALALQVHRRQGTLNPAELRPLRD